MQGLEPALGVAFPKGTPCLHRLSEALERGRRKFRELEQIPQQARVPSDSTTAPASARSCSRAARFGVSPAIPRSRGTIGSDNG